MKEYMVIFLIEGIQSVSFYDRYQDAENARMNCECGMGGYAEVYKYSRLDENDEYEPLSYICIS